MHNVFEGCFSGHLSRECVCSGGYHDQDPFFYSIRIMKQNGRRLPVILVACTRGVCTSLRLAVPPLGDTAQFCLFCCQPEPIPASLSAGAQLTPRCPYRVPNHPRVEQCLGAAAATLDAPRTMAALSFASGSLPQVGAHAGAHPRARVGKTLF